MSGELALVQALEESGVITPTGLTLDPDISFMRYEALGRLLGRMHDATKWWIADWLLYGEQRFGERAAQAAAATVRSERTLVNYAWTASNVPPTRRRESLSFTHHVLVAPLQGPEQSRWLERAERHEWSSRELGLAIAKSRFLEPPQAGAWQTLVDTAADMLASRLAAHGGARVRVVAVVDDGVLRARAAS